MATREEEILQNAGVDLNKFNSLVADGMSKSEAVKAASGQSTTTTPTTTKATTTTTPTTSTSSGNQWSSSNYKDSDGYYSATERNAATAGSEFGGTTTPIKTTTTAATPKVETTTTPSNSLANKWNEYSYEEQQAILKANPNIQKELTSRGITNKTAPTTTATPTSTTTTPKDKWDYQDNSPERMAEIADNVNRFAITDPQLFASEEAFRNFFIDGKGRTPEQEKFLMDFYKNRKTYNELDNYTADQIGSMYVNGKIPDSYLNYLKNTNPDRYAYVMDAKAKATDKITDTAGADSIANLMGEMDDSETVWGKMVEWAKKEGLLVDANGDLIDDRLYHEASQEEKTYAKEYSDNLARIMELQQTKRDIYDDYVKAYPGATKATLLALTNDATTEIQKEIDNLTVENTRLQGYIGYAQSERQQQDAAGKQTIADLQKDYGLYYSYSPEGMSELAQAQYAATNVTLDQADQGTYTQKQMALESVLSPIYQQYGSIIQRPMAQVINDVIAYAQNNGVSLSQALEENFMKPLKAKPAYKQLSSAEPYTVKVGDALYQYDFETGEFTPVNVSTIGTATGLGTMRTERNNNPTAMTTDVARSLGLVEGEDYVKGDSFKDENGKTLYTAKFLNDPVETTIKALDNGANSSSTHAFYTAGGSQRWKHTAMSDAEWLAKTPEEKQETVLKMLQREGGDITKMSYYNQGDTVSVSEQNSKFGGLAGWNNDGYSDNLVKDYEMYISSPDKISKTDIEAKYSPLGMSYYDFTTQAQNYAKTGMKDKYVGAVSSSLEAAVELYEYINGNKAKFEGRDIWNWSSLLNDMFRGGNVQAGLLSKLFSYIPTTKQYDAKSYFDALNNRETLQKLIETKAQGATYGAMSEGEWKLLASASNLLDRNQSGEQFQKNLENLIYALSTAVQEGGGTLPTNYYKSTASNMIMQGENSGRWNAYKQDNTPFYADVNYDTYSTSGPSEI